MGNWILAIVLFLSAAIGITAATMSERANHEARTSYAQSLAGSMQVYRNSVLKYAQAHATSSGEVDDANLALPAWFKRNSDIKTYISGGLGYVYVAVQNDGQARQLLEATNNDVNVGINRGGVLYNPLAGTTVIALPSAIPEGAVVFAPAALSTAGPVPAAPAAPANCTVPTGTARSWTVGGTSCSATLPSYVTLAHLQAQTFTDAAPGTTGTAQFYCVDGTLQTTPGGSPTCNPPPPCNVAAGTTRSWTVGGATCSGPHAATTIPSGTSLTFTSTNGNDGAAGFVCNEGTLSATPDGSQTCTVPPAPCVLPSPATQTVATESRTASQTISGCPAGYTGTITQTRPEQRTQTHTAYCPAPAGAYAWGAPSAWSAWTPTGGWTTVSSSCALICVPPASTSESITRTVADETQNVGCPAGQTGEQWQQRSRIETGTRTTTWTCPSTTGSPTSSTTDTWSGSYTPTSGWATTSNTCATPAPTCASASDPITLVRYKACTNGTGKTISGAAAQKNPATGDYCTTWKSFSGTYGSPHGGNYSGTNTFSIELSWHGVTYLCSYSGYINTSSSGSVWGSGTLPPGVSCGTVNFYPTSQGWGSGGMNILGPGPQYAACP